jgi:hypothetical protein
MHVQKTVVHQGKTITHGSFGVRETVHVCAARCRHPSGALVTRQAQRVQQLLLPGRTVSYDVMVYVGTERFVHHRQREEIRAALEAQHDVVLSTGTISDLTQLFGQYLRALHEHRADALRAALQADGGYPMHIDATGENGRGTLLVTYAGWRRWVLGAWKIPTERADVIVPRLREVTTLFGPPCAIVRDLGRAMIPAAKELVAELKHFMQRGRGSESCGCWGEMAELMVSSERERVRVSRAGRARCCRTQPAAAVPVGIPAQR